MTERTLFEIVSAIKDGASATHDELRYALLAMSALHHFDSQALMKLWQRAEKGQDVVKSAFGVRWMMEESYRRAHVALNKPPKQWLGESNDPDTAECQAIRKAALSVLAKVTRDREGATNG